MKKKPFYPEYMVKRRPKVPRCMCRTLADWIIGKMSPSLVFMAWADKEKAEALDRYHEQQKKYLCWKRQLSRESWKVLYRQHRSRQRYYFTDTKSEGVRIITQDGKQ